MTAVLDTDPGLEECRRVRIKPATVLDVAAADARAADADTGRNVATAHETVAQLLGCSVSTVRRARGVLERLGLAATIATGRYLTTAERAAARALHGLRQVRTASLRALTMPRHAPRPASHTMPAVAPANQDEHLPRRGLLSFQVTPRSGLPTDAPERAAGAARDARSNKQPRPTRRPSPRATPRPLELQRLAAKLANRLPWLARGHIGRLCDALARLQLPPGWTAADLIAAIDADNAARELYALTPSGQRNPLGLFLTQAQRATAGKEPPAVTAARDRAQLRTAQAARTAQHAADIAAAVPPTDAYRQARQALRNRPRHIPQ